MHPYKPEAPICPEAEGRGRGIVARLKSFMPHHLQPESIRRFERVELAGNGAMAEVFRAFDKRLGKEVALKIGCAEERGRTSIENEIRALSQARHRNIVRLLDSGVFTDGTYERRPFLVLGFIRGGNLQNILRNEGTLGRVHAKHMMMELCDALTAVHEAGFVHRDMKPENIIVGPDGPVLLDFGVSEPLLSRFSLRSFVMQRFMPGNVEFSAPEIFMGKSDQRTDIYAAGMLLRLMRLGSLPQDPAQLLGGKTALLDDIAISGAGLCAAEISVITRATCASPDGRYANADELRADLSRI